MIKAVATQPDGRKLVLLGLSADNYALLAPDRQAPLMVRGAQIDLDFDLMVFTGTDERTMAAQMKEHLGVQDVREADPAPPPTAPAPSGADVDHGGLPHDAMMAATHAAHQALVDHGVSDPALVLIAQDARQRRGMSCTVANPADLLRVVLFNLEQAGM